MKENNYQLNWQPENSIILRKKTAKLKKIREKGYNAFYYLVISDQIPFRVSYSHLEMALNFKNSHLDEELQQSIERMITTPKFFNYLLNHQSRHKLYELLELTKKWTNKFDQFDPLIHYFNNHSGPFEISHVLHISPKLSKCIYQNPGQLDLFTSQALEQALDYEPDLIKLISEFKTIFFKLSPKYLKKMVLDPFYEANKLKFDKLSLFAIEQLLLYGNTTFLPLIPNENLIKMVNLIHDTTWLPEWLRPDLILEIENRLQHGSIPV